MSILAKDCPECGETNPAYAVRCRCGYEFNETVDCGEEQDDLALTVQEEELYLEYLQARAQQATADARNAAQAAAAQPNNKVAASQAERAQLAAQTATAEFESQQARVATAIKTLQGNNRASPLADSGSARQTSAPATSQALPSTAAPPRTPPEATVSPTATAKSERPASATSPVTRSSPANKPSNVQETATGPAVPATTAGAEPCKASRGTGTPAAIVADKATAPTANKAAAVAATPGSAVAAAPDPRAMPSTHGKPTEDERPAAPMASANGIAGGDVPRKPTEVPKVAAHDHGERDEPAKQPASAVATGTANPAVPDASSSQQQDAASAKALAAAARAKALTEKLKAAQAARAAKAQSASAAPPSEKTGLSPKPVPPKSGAVTHASAPPAQSAPARSAPPPPAKGANGQHHNGYDKLVADLDAIKVPGVDGSEGDPVTAPVASTEPTRGETEVKNLAGTAPAAPATPAAPVAPTATVSATPSVDPQAELEAALRALTASPSVPVSAESATASHAETVATAQAPQTRAVGTKPAAVASSVPADQKDCPNCTALLPLTQMRCRCGYTFPTVEETMPALSLSDSDLAAMGDESPKDRITHLS